MNAFYGLLAYQNRYAAACWIKINEDENVHANSGYAERRWHCHDSSHTAVRALFKADADLAISLVGSSLLLQFMIFTIALCAL